MNRTNFRGEFVVVLNKDEDTIALVDTKTRRVIKTIASDHNPHEVAITPDGKKTYVTCSLGNTIDVIDNNTFEIVTRITDDAFDFPHGVGIDKQGILYMASTYSNMVFVIDTKTDTIIDRFKTNEEHSHMIAFTPGALNVYVPNIGSNTLTLFDARTHKIKETIPVGNGPEGVAVHPDGKHLYVANQHDNTLYVMSTVTHEILWKRKLGNCPIRVVFTADGKYALIPNRESDDLSIILTNQRIKDTIRPWEIKRIPVGKWPGGVALSSDDTVAYVANNKTNDISIIDMKTLKEIARIDVGIHPDGLAYLKC